MKKMTRERKLLIWITVADCVLMVIMMTSYSYIGSHDSYVKFGPHDDTVLMGLTIDTWPKYIGSVVFLIGFIAFQTCREVYVYPWVMNNVYDDKTLCINQFTKGEVNFIVNGNYASDGLWYMIGIWMVTSQIDFALIKWITSAIANYLVVRRRYLSKKSYGDIEQGVGGNLFYGFPPATEY